jgi:hypothetical protein
MGASFLFCEIAFKFLGAAFKIAMPGRPMAMYLVFFCVGVASVVAMSTVDDMGTDGDSSSCSGSDDDSAAAGMLPESVSDDDGVSCSNSTSSNSNSISSNCSTGGDGLWRSGMLLHRSSLALKLLATNPKMALLLPFQFTFG